MTVANTLDVARSSLIKRLNKGEEPRRRPPRVDDAALLALLKRLVDERPTYGYRRICALMNRELARDGAPKINHKRAYRMMRDHGFLLEKSAGQRPGRVHDGKVVVMRSDLRWCSDGLEFAAWNGEIIRFAFVIDAHDREVIAWKAVSGCGIAGSDVRDMMLEAVERRFGAQETPHAVEFLADNGSPYTAKETRVFATQLGLTPCFTPVASPESNGVAEAFVKTFKRDYVRVNPLPSAEHALAQIAGWIEDYNEIHPHSGLRMRSPRECRRAQS